MTIRPALLCIATLAIVLGQSAPKAVITNLDTAPFHHDQGDAPGSESVLLHEDPRNGGMDLLVRFPAGHVFAPHWHDSNERIIVLEGQLTLTENSGPSVVNQGGFAFLPAHEVQRLACTSQSRCTFYLAWDGNPKSHPAK